MLLRWLTYVVVLIFTPDVFPQKISRNKRSNDYIPCEYGWFHFREKCYRIGGATRNLNWNGSVEHCTTLGANLASVESKEENDFLIALLLLEIKKSAWIGLNDQDEEGNYKWQSGSTSAYRNWRANEPTGESKKENVSSSSSRKSFNGIPSKVMANQEDCVQLLVDLYSDSVGEWNDNSCDHSTGYICEKKSDPNLRSPNLRYCPSADGGGFRFLGSCYHLVTVMKSWEEAEQHCVDTYGGHLITVLDKTVDFYLKYLLQSIQAEVWIGIKIRDQYQQKWSSGWFVGYHGFNKEHRDFLEGTCVVRTQMKKWNIVPCSKKFSFICEKSVEKIPTLKPPVKGSYCPSIPHNWRDLDGELCYFIETENTVTWYEANFQCMSRGGNLLSIHSKEEGDILHPFIHYTGTAAFIGLFRQYGRENTFGWTDGSAINFVNWSPWEPNNENEKCVEARENDMKWNDIHCDDKRAYICAIRKITPNLTTASTEKSESDGECSGSVSVKALIGVAVCIVIVVILLGVVIYNFRPSFVVRKKSSPAVVGLQPCAPAPRQKYRSAEIKNNEQDPYYETMDT